MKNNTIIIVIAIMILSVVSFAAITTETNSGGAQPRFNGTLQIEKTAPQNVSLDEQFSVNIRITNLESSAVNATVQELLGNVEPIEPLPIYSNPGEIYAAQPPKLTWAVNVAPGSTQTIRYTIKPTTVGVISIGPTTVLVSGNAFYSNSLFVDVECTVSSSCDSRIGETPLTCPAKCGGNANQPPPAAPQQRIIPTSPINNTQVNNPESVVTDLDKTQIRNYDDKKNMEYVVIIPASILIIGALYFLFLRKK